MPNISAAAWQDGMPRRTIDPYPQMYVGSCIGMIRRCKGSEGGTHRLMPNTMNIILPLLKWLDACIFRHKWGWFCSAVFDASIAADFKRMGDNHPFMQLWNDDDA